MTATTAADDHTPAAGVGEPDVIDDELIAWLARQARTQGVSLVGEGGLLQQLTKRL